MTQTLARAAAALFAVACAACAAATSAPRADLVDGAVGTVALRTYTPASQRPLLTRSYLNDPPTVITGILSLPTQPPLQRDGKSPPVILMHGSGGVSDEREHAWAKRLNSWGIAEVRSFLSTVFSR